MKDCQTKVHTSSTQATGLLRRSYWDYYYRCFLHCWDYFDEAPGTLLVLLHTLLLYIPHASRQTNLPQVILRRGDIHYQRRESSGRVNASHEWKSCPSDTSPCIPTSSSTRTVEEEEEKAEKKEGS